MSKRLVLAVSALILGLATAASVHAQSSPVLEGSIPFEFTVGSSQLPAGIYRIAQVGPALRITNMDSKKTVMVLATPLQENKAVEQGAARLLFRRYGDQHFLSKIWLRNEGWQPPQSRLERQLAAQFQESDISIAASPK